MPRALLYVSTFPDSSVPEDSYHAWYDHEHLKSRLSVPGVSSALRFKSTEAKQWLALFDLDSVDVLKSKEYAALKEKASDNERALISHVNMDRRVYEEIYSVGRQSTSPQKTLLAVEMTPYKSHEKEFHHYYQVFTEFYRD